MGPVPAPTGHVVAPGSGPGLIAWLPGAVAVVGIIVLGFVPRLRRLGTGVAAAGFAGLVALNVVASSAPSPPGYAISLVAPRDGARVTSPMLVVACGRNPDGSSATVPGPDRVLSFFVDERQTFESRTATVALQMSPGRHRLRVEVLTSDHREFQTPL